MSDFGRQLLSRLSEAANRGDQTLKNNKIATQHLKRALPVIDRTLKGNEIAMAAIREVYGVLEADAEELSTTKAELKEATDALEVSNDLLEQAGLDMANIQTAFGNDNDEVWFGNHLPTIKRITKLVNLELWEIALDEEEQERFEDIAHAVKRSGKKREKKSDDPA